MGFQIDRSEFTNEERDRFKQRLVEDLDTLRTCLDAGDFCSREESFGAEVELVIIDEQGEPQLLGSTLRDELADPQWALEIDRFNLEYNLSPVAARGAPFSTMNAELVQALSSSERAAQRHASSLCMIGILPTLQPHHLTSAAMSDLPRYHAMAEAILERRRAGLAIDINGANPLHTIAENVTWEGANTSFQLHMRVAADKFAGLYNALQLAIAPVLAVSTNSPLFCGHDLWEETRIALFKQAVDARVASTNNLHMPPRVGFGTGWVQQGALELFAQCVTLFPPLLPVLDSERVADPKDRGPALTELRLHAGTVWTWNRPVYDPSHGGHLRIEARALPAGPTTLDMMANAAFLAGIGHALARDITRMTEQMPFSFAEWNFYRAAQFGLDAQLVWPGRYTMRKLSARQLARELLPVADQGLAQLSVDAAERRTWLDIIAARLDAGITGARWQRATLQTFEASLSRDLALRALTASYRELSRAGQPVHTWPL